VRRLKASDGKLPDSSSMFRSDGRAMPSMGGPGCGRHKKEDPPKRAFFRTAAKLALRRSLLTA
jgi:hypothetical protein